MTSQPPRPIIGILLMTCAVTLFTTMAAFIKAADRVPAGEAMFFRSFFALFVVAAWLSVTGTLRDGIRTNAIRLMRSAALSAVAPWGSGSRV